MTVAISSALVAAIRREAAASPRVEVCGLLFGEGEWINAHQPCRNVAAQPGGSFEIDPAALIAAYREERGGGRRIGGCYHSHPSGDAQPSARDAAAATANGWIWLIVAVDDVRAFRTVDRGSIYGRFDPVAIRAASDA